MAPNVADINDDYKGYARKILQISLKLVGKEMVTKFLVLSFNLLPKNLALLTNTAYFCIACLVSVPYPGSNVFYIRLLSSLSLGPSIFWALCTLCIQYGL